ncbi:MAG TPA: hypothetical protein V6D25_27510 [Leptolyngbyaceae cyanobacterium]
MPKRSSRALSSVLSDELTACILHLRVEESGAALPTLLKHQGFKEFQKLGTSQK